jgi:4-alpha-glucanotransferase
MKLRFAINYRTEWGQQIIVCINYEAKDASTHRVQLPLTTQDGDQWVGETAVVESRRSPILTFNYYYIVADGEGRELRREWNLVGRTYAFDASKTFVFNDLWREMPLNAHLYTQAYRWTNGEQEEQVDGSSLQLPLFRKTVLFRVAAPQLLKGQRMAILGSHPALGAWNPTRYLPMQYVGECHWMLTLNVDWIGLPIEYKYVVIDDHSNELLSWEEGDNRMVDCELAEGEVAVLYGEPLRLAEKTWRIAGVCVPVFALRSEHSCGVGDFGDLKRMTDWAVLTGMSVIQLLPVNDTTLSHQWGDSYPYNIVSAFALHPHYMDLEQLGTLKDKRRMTAFRRQQRELNALGYSDYEAVDRVKMAYIREMYQEQGEKTMASQEFKTWKEENSYWLTDYVAFATKHAQAEEDGAFYEYVQYQLHLQLKAAADYARQHGVVLKGDLPIGVNRESAETTAHPELFNMDSQTGAPPDAFAMQGQNWGFPTYRWETDEQTAQQKDSMTISKWFRRRLKHQEQYFDALRIDHVLGFFRIWEIPNEQLYGTMGHFSPAMPMTASEIEYFGLPFRKDFLTRPFINDRIVDRLFGIHANYVRDTFLMKKAYGLYDLKETVDTQKKVRDCFEGKGDENSLWIRDGLYRLVANVLFVEDPRQPEMYHPRIAAYQEPVFEALGGDERDAYMRIYNNFFYQRHSMLWGHSGYSRLTDVLADSRMLICAEDLGMLPDCVEPVLDALRMLTLEIQQMPKQTGMEFAHLDANPVRSVATISTHDMAPLRLWWEESAERTQRYYTTMLQKQGRAPEHLPAHLAEEILARHLYSPSMLCILSLQDWLAMDSELWNKNTREERINVPSDAFNRWQYRMHLTIEELMKADRFNNKVKTMVKRSKR